MASCSGGDLKVRITRGSDLRPLGFEGAQYGGALMTTTDVENYPGFPEGILGPEVLGKFREPKADVEALIDAGADAAERVIQDAPET